MLERADLQLLIDLVENKISTMDGFYSDEKRVRNQLGKIKRNLERMAGKTGDPAPNNVIQIHDKYRDREAKA